MRQILREIGRGLLWLAWFAVSYTAGVWCIWHMSPGLLERLTAPGVFATVLLLPPWEWRGYVRVVRERP